MEEKSPKSLSMWLIIILIVLLVIWGVYELVDKNKTPSVTDNSNNNIPTATSTTQDDVPSDWNAYTNDQYFYRLRYPESIIFTKDLSVANEDGTQYSTYKAGSKIPVKVADISSIAGSPTRSRVTITPLYIEINVIKKPSGYQGLKKYVDNAVEEAIKQGENSAAGVYADSSDYSVNGLNGYLVVVSDGSVVKNRDDKYYFERGENIYTFDMAYSGYYYETKDSDETMRVDTAKKIFSTFKFTK